MKKNVLSEDNRHLLCVLEFESFVRCTRIDYIKGKYLLRFNIYWPLCLSLVELLIQSHRCKYAQIGWFEWRWKIKSPQHFSVVKHVQWPRNRILSATGAKRSKIVIIIQWMMTIEKKTWFNFISYICFNQKNQQTHTHMNQSYIGKTNTRSNMCIFFYLLASWMNNATQRYDWHTDTCTHMTAMCYVTDGRPNVNIIIICDYQAQDHIHVCCVLVERW